MSTYPIINAAAVLIYLPSPRGFLGTSDIGKLYLGGSCTGVMGAAAPVVSLGTEDISRVESKVKRGRERRCGSKSKRVTTVGPADIDGEVPDEIAWIAGLAHETMYRADSLNDVNSAIE